MSTARPYILALLSGFQSETMLQPVFQSAGYEVTFCTSLEEGFHELGRNIPDLILVSDPFQGQSGPDICKDLFKRTPAVPVVILFKQAAPETARAALDAGASDWVVFPVRTEEFLQTLQNTLARARARRDGVMIQARRATTSLARRVGELEALTRLAQQVTASLDLDSVLAAVVSAAVELTGAEEGSLMLLDENSGELYMRAARNFNEEFVQTFRLKVDDSLAGAVLRTGQPVLLGESFPKKITSSYLVNSLVYVPLQIHDKVLGILGVDNRQKQTYFQQRDVHMLSTLAQFAVISLENARLYASVTREHEKLETLLSNIQDGVIVLDSHQRLLMANQVAQDMFGLDGRSITGQDFSKIFSQPELRELVTPTDLIPPQWMEINQRENTILEARISTIPGVGQAVILHDISHLKKLDHLKTDLVNTVSHDLRSPLTTIMGYVSLLERAGPLNEKQLDFTQRINTTVRNISNLVDDLLNLSRIEGGYGARMEEIDMHALICKIMEENRKRLEDRQHHAALDLCNSPAILLADPLQIRQLIENLLENAIKYTPPGGSITLHTEWTQAQFILQVKDTGIGIPVVEQGQIFDRFFRASNITDQTSGTGLGLSIVKSIIENHRGRIWVDSAPGKGSTFTVVLPAPCLDNPL